MTVTLLAAAFLGLGIGLVLGGLGAGGSMLAVPALVYLLGQEPYTATTASLVVVGTTALAGAVAHSRGGRVRWRRGLVFGVLGVVGSVAGTAVAAHLDPQVLMLAFAVLMLLVAMAMLRGLRSPPSAPEVPPPGGSASEGSPPVGSAPVGSAPVGSAPVGSAPGARAGRGTRAARVVLAASGVGILTGIFGVGGGFVVVPALVLTLGMDMTVAVGTSLVVIAVNSAVALAARLGTPAQLNWGVVIPFALFAVLGAVASTRLVDVVPVRVVTGAFTALLVLVAVGMGASAAMSLT